MTEKLKTLETIIELLIILEQSVGAMEFDPLMVADADSRLLHAGFADSASSQIRLAKCFFHTSYAGSMFMSFRQSESCVKDDAIELSILLRLSEAHRMVVAFGPILTEPTVRTAVEALTKLIDDNFQDLSTLEMERAECRSEKIDELGMRIAVQMHRELSAVTADFVLILKEAAVIAYHAVSVDDEKLFRSAIGSSAILKEITGIGDWLTHNSSDEPVEELVKVLAAWIGEFIELYQEDKVGSTNTRQEAEAIASKFRLMSEDLVELQKLLKPVDKGLSERMAALATAILGKGQPYSAYFELS